MEDQLHEILLSSSVTPIVSFQNVQKKFLGESEGRNSIPHFFIHFCTWDKEAFLFYAFWTKQFQIPYSAKTLLRRNAKMSNNAECFNYLGPYFKKLPQLMNTENMDSDILVD